MEFQKLLQSFVLVLLCACTVRSTTAKYHTYEEDAPGTFIGNLSQDLKPELPEDPQMSFRFMQEGNTSLIRMRKQDGLITVGGRIDRESLCGSSVLCTITTDVVVFSKEKFHLIHVEIHVRDINDHAPEFPLEKMTLEVSEDAALGTRFPLKAATDLDVGNNYIQKYQLFNSTYFDLEIGSGEDGKKFAQLILVKELDREYEDSLTVEVIASDGGSPAKSGSLMVQVTVLDSNDNSPQFEHDKLRVELYEDAPVGILLHRVQAFDLDHGVNGDVRYDFTESVSSEIRNTFVIDSVSGAVILNATIDYEKRKSYELHIKAYDLGANSVPSTSMVTVDVVDVNDNAPEVSIKPMTSRSGDMAYITEAAAVESFVALISTTDKDSGANGYVQLSLHGHEHFKLQQAYGDTMMIITTSALDREKIPEYNLTVTAEDLGSPPFKTFIQYTIRVIDENDNVPSFSKPVYEVSVMENKPPGSYVASLVARDPDEAANSKVTYKLLENEVDGIPVSYFLKVDPASGAIYTVRSLDYESVKQIEVVIQATDSGSPSLSSTAQVKIKVVDENDNTPFLTHPIFINDTADVSLPCNAPAGYVVLRLEGNDADEETNAELSYTIVEDEMQLFVMNENSGEMSLKHGLSLELGETLEIKVAVSDHGRTSLVYEATIRFVIRDAISLDNQMPVLLESIKKDNESTFDASFIIIGLLAAACAVLLVAIVGVALSYRKHQRNGRYITKIAGRNFRKTSFPSHSIDSSDSSSISGGSATATEQITSTRDESSSSDEEMQSRESDSKVFRPLINKTHFQPGSIWQGDKYTLQTSELGSSDRSSIKDSGKGDSDFNDSDSDICGQTSRKISTINHQRASSSLYPADGACRTREIPIHTTHTHIGNGRYTIAYRPQVYGLHHTSPHQTHLMSNCSFNSVFLRAPSYPQPPMFHKMGTLPPNYYGRVHKQTVRESIPDVIASPGASF